MVTMAAYYKFVQVSVFLLIWTPWPRLVADAQSATTALTPDNLSAKEGETVTLVCTYQPETDDFSFASLAWRMGDTLLASYECPNACSRTNANSDRYTLDVDSKSSGNLTITGVSLADDNVYECRVFTFYGSAKSYSRLVVNVPPTIKNKANNRTTANEGKTASLSCVIEGNPSPRVNWERIGNHSVALWNRTLVVNTEVNSDYRSMVTSTLNIVDVHPDIDHGNYKCTAESTAGRDEAVINLSGTCQPEKPSNVSVLEPSITSTSFSVAWQTNSSDGRPETYTVTYCEVDVPEECTKIYEVSPTRLTIGGLRPSTVYRVTVKSQNDFGFSEDSEFIEIFTQSIPSSNNEVITVVPWGLSLLISVSVVVNIVLVAIIVYLKMKKKQRSRILKSSYFTKQPLPKTAPPTQTTVKEIAVDSNKVHESGDHVYQDLNAPPRLAEQGCDQEGDQEDDQADFILDHSYEDFPATKEREESRVIYSNECVRVLK